MSAWGDLLSPGLRIISVDLLISAIVAILAVLGYKLGTAYVGLARIRNAGRPRSLPGRGAWGRLLDRLDPGPNPKSLTGRLIRIARSRTLADVDAPEVIEATKTPETFVSAKSKFDVAVMGLGAAVIEAGSRAISPPKKAEVVRAQELAEALRGELERASRDLAQAKGEVHHLTKLISDERAKGRAFVEDVQKAAEADKRALDLLVARVKDLEEERDAIASEAWRRRCELKDLREHHAH